MAPPTDVSSSVVTWTRIAKASASSFAMPTDAPIVTAASSNVPTYPGAAGIAVARFVPAARSAAWPVVGWMPTAWAAAANASTVHDQDAIDRPTAAPIVRPLFAIASPSRSRTSTSRTRGQRLRYALTRSAPGSRWAAIPTAMATTSSADTASPTSTAEATIPRTESTRIAIEAIATTTTVSTTRSTTIVPRIVERDSPVLSPRSTERTISPSRAGRMLLAR